MALSRRCWRTRAYGDFWSYMLVAEGAVDLAAEPELELYDMAALDVIVREAGGTVHLARRPRRADRWQRAGEQRHAPRPGARPSSGPLPDDADDPRRRAGGGPGRLHDLSAASAAAGQPAPAAAT